MTDFFRRGFQLVKNKRNSTFELCEVSQWTWIYKGITLESLECTSMKYMNILLLIPVFFLSNPCGYPNDFRVSETAFLRLDSLVPILPLPPLLTMLFLSLFLGSWSLIHDGLSWGLFNVKKYLCCSLQVLPSQNVSFSVWYPAELPDRLACHFVTFGLKKRYWRICQQVLIK